MNTYTTTISSKFFALFVAIATLFAGASIAFASVSFNQAQNDCATMRVRNNTQNVPTGLSGACNGLASWATGSISAQPGDVISIALYYHNTGDTIATGTKLRITSGQTQGSTSAHTIAGQVSSTSGGTASGSVTVNVSSAQTLEFIPGSVVWYSNSGSTQPLLNGQSGSELFGSGLVVGDVDPTWADQGSIRAQFRVGQLALDPTVTTDQALNITDTTAQLVGTIDNHNAPSQVWFVYGLPGTLSTQTSVVTYNASNTPITFNRTVNNLTPGTTYEYRAVGRLQGVTGGQDIYGAIHSFTTTGGQQPTYQCNDGQDNDGDGYTDYPNDPGCNSSTDNTEAPYNTQTYQCNDGSDNDGDGYVDYPNDPGCSSTNDNSEAPYNFQTYQCNDGQDNDGDGYTDYPNDPGCSSSNDSSEYNSIVNNLDVDTYAPQSVSEDSATLRGNINQIGQNGVTRYFKWGTSSNNLIYTLSVSGTIYGTGSFAQTLSGLTDGTTYYYKACAQEVSTGVVDCGTTYNFTTTNIIVSTNLSAVTTIATGVSQTSATINGLTIGSNNSGTINTWFEYGPTTSFGQTTGSLTVSAVGTQNVSRSISNLSSNTYYYFRIVAQKTDGTLVYGQTKFFQTLSATVPQPPIVVVNGTGQGAIFVALDITPDFENVFVGDTVNFTVKYRNISNVDLKNLSVRVIFPKELQYMKSEKGFYSSGDNTLTNVVGDLDKNEKGQFLVQVKVISRSASGDLIVTTAEAIHDHPNLVDAQTNVLANAINIVSQDRSNLVGLSLFGGGFFPTTFFGWLLLLLVILVLVLVARNLYMKNGESKKPSQTLKIN